MKQTKEEQLLALIDESSSVLIALPENPTTDAIASGLAMLSVLEKKEKRVKVVAAGFQLPANHSFLPKSDEIFDDVSALRKFVISLDLARASVEEVSYDIEDAHMKVYVTPKDGFFEESDVSTTSTDYSYDLVITIDAPDLESLGRIHEMNADFFYHTPIINIDHSPANDHYGQVNLVQVTATSSSEIVFELISEWEGKMLDEYIATSLLAGMISKTRSFKSGSITPRSLAIASHLVSQGARRDEIVKHLYQSKKISTLKLWGRALSQLEADLDNKIVWSLLSEKDFEETGAAESELPDVIDELIINTPDAKNVFLLHQHKNIIKGYISVAPFLNVQELFSDLQPSGTEHFAYIEARDRSLESLRDSIRGRLQKAVQQTRSSS